METEEISEETEEISEVFDLSWLEEELEQPLDKSNKKTWSKIRDDTFVFIQKINSIKTNLVKILELATVEREQEGKKIKIAPEKEIIERIDEILATIKQYKEAYNRYGFETYNNSTTLPLDWLEENVVTPLTNLRVYFKYYFDKLDVSVTISKEIVDEYEKFTTELIDNIPELCREVSPELYAKDVVEEIDSDKELGIFHTKINELPDEVESILDPEVKQKIERMLENRLTHKNKEILDLRNKISSMELTVANAQAELNTEKMHHEQFKKQINEHYIAKVELGEKMPVPDLPETDRDLDDIITFILYDFLFNIKKTKGQWDGLTVSEIRCIINAYYRGEYVSTALETKESLYRLKKSSITKEKKRAGKFVVWELKDSQQAKGRVNVVKKKFRGKFLFFTDTTGL